MKQPLGHTTALAMEEQMDFVTIMSLKSNKCNQIDFASPKAGNLRRPLETHSGKKSNTCNQCDYAGKQFEEAFINVQWKSHSNAINESM